MLLHCRGVPLFVSWNSSCVREDREHHFGVPLLTCHRTEPYPLFFTWVYYPSTWTFPACLPFQLGLGPVWTVQKLLNLEALLAHWPQFTLSTESNHALLSFSRTLVKPLGAAAMKPQFSIGDSDVRNVPLLYKMFALRSRYSRIISTSNLIKHRLV